MKIVVISDTHTLHGKLHIPDGDLLIHCGDFCSRGSLHEVEKFNAFLTELPHQHKIVISGNHDICFDTKNSKARNYLTNCTYLQDDAIEVEGIKFYGSPWQPEFLNWAFNLPRGASLKRKWDLIPDDTDILITHSPPYGICDQTQEGMNVGCEELLKAVQRIKPRYHLFGHIHESYGYYEGYQDETIFINASICTVRYQPINEPIVFDYRFEKD